MPGAKFCPRRRWLSILPVAADGDHTGAGDLAFSIGCLSLLLATVHSTLLGALFGPGAGRAAQRVELLFYALAQILDAWLIRCLWCRSGSITASSWR